MDENKDPNFSAMVFESPETDKTFLLSKFRNENEELGKVKMPDKVTSTLRTKDTIGMAKDSNSPERRKNPFLQITPQMKRAVRKNSAQNLGSVSLEFSSPQRKGKLECEAPFACK